MSGRRQLCETERTWAVGDRARLRSHPTLSRGKYNSVTLRSLCQFSELLSDLWEENNVDVIHIAVCIA